MLEQQFYGHFRTLVDRRYYQVSGNFYSSDKLLYGECTHYTDTVLVKVYGIFAQSKLFFL